MNQRDQSTVVEVDGKSLRLTHLSKVMFPDDGFTKAELLLYYQTIAPLLLPHLRGRPLTLKAFPHGVKERPYYRRRLASTAPPWLSRVELEDGAAPVVEDAADLLWVVNQDSVEIHPWLSRKENLNYPDLLVFDLDPGSRLPFQRLCEAATVVKEALDALGSWVKTSGTVCTVWRLIGRYISGAFLRTSSCCGWSPQAILSEQTQLSSQGEIVNPRYLLLLSDVK